MATVSAVYAHSRSWVVPPTALQPWRSARGHAGAGARGEADLEVDEEEKDAEAEGVVHDGRALQLGQADGHRLARLLEREGVGRLAEGGSVIMC